MKQRDKLRADAVLCLSWREDLSLLLFMTELPAIWGSRVCLEGDGSAEQQRSWLCSSSGALCSASLWHQAVCTLPSLSPNGGRQKQAPTDTLTPFPLLPARAVPGSLPNAVSAAPGASSWPACLGGGPGGSGVAGGFPLGGRRGWVRLRLGDPFSWGLRSPAPDPCSREGATPAGQHKEPRPGGLGRGLRLLPPPRLLLPEHPRRWRPGSAQLGTAVPGQPSAAQPSPQRLPS